MMDRLLNLPKSAYIAAAVVAFFIVLLALGVLKNAPQDDRADIYARFHDGDTALLNLLNAPSAQLVACIQKCVALDQNGNPIVTCVQEEGESASRGCWQNEACFANESNGWYPCGGE